ncbi:peptidase domain-containing ABC transporter [Pseudomonas syringae group genomosp. 3]|uniref:Putative toxin transporter n=1 Tax=Pseudomonas syringae pv. primulae TaxID=251707 RepID=A0A3M3YBW1_9PSED|nr:peptidase domain-containing ABC transporter [Pseudomonas syringae group genomosp. 3]RMO79033.1 putative toxin transporter [Pseudomonas syringae pv. primulae]RMU38037.1 putative toxin transporter [Pseudomonas syringae pv. primulae]
MSYLDAITLRLGRRMPLILQTEATECGLACLAMIAGYYGNHTTLLELRNLFRVSLKGVTLKQLIQTAERLKLATRPVRLELENLSKLKLPCILHWNFNHFVVLEAADNQRLVIHDPAHGVRQLSLTEAGKSFTGVALELWPDSDFEQQKAKPQIKLMSMLGRVSGLYRALAQVLSLALALEVFSLVSPFLLQWTLDNVLVTQDGDLLKTLIIGFGILLLMQQLVSATRAWVMMHMSTLLSVQWRANVFSHLLRLPIDYFEKRHLGDIVSRFGAIGEIQQTLTAAFFSTLLDGLMTIATLALMFVYSPLLASIAVIAMTLYTLLRWAWYCPLRRAAEEQIIHAARQESHFLETMRGIRALKLFQRQSDRRSIWLGLLVEQINAGLRTQKLKLIYIQFNSLIFGLENLLALGVGASMVMNNQFSVGVLMAYIAYKSQFVSRVASLIDNLFALHMLRLQGERLADIVTHPPESNGNTPSSVAWPTGPIDIDIKGLKYRYSDQEPFVLSDVTLCIRHGESVAITGASGCGKSTLVNLLLGIFQPTQGQIQIAGSDLHHIGIENFRSKVGTVMQDDYLFAGSLAENIAFFDAAFDQEWVVKCARKASIHEDILNMPMGYNTLVGDMGTVLSGGQKQRILLARALYKKPEILILDEATSHLDVQCERQVNEAVRKLDMTRIIIAHRSETIFSADRVVVLEAGRIVSDSLSSIIQLNFSEII